MPGLRVLSGKEVVAFLIRQGFFIHRQKGSHIILHRIMLEQKKVLLVPNHAVLDRGTTHEIYKQAKGSVVEEALKHFFFKQ